MNFHQLEVFAAVVRLGSFSKAAKALFLTQPTVSSHISALEESLGLPLVERGRNKAVLPTKAGAVFYGYANGLLKMRDNVLASMRQYPELLTGTLELAASTVPAEYLLPETIAAFREEYPGIRFCVRESDSERVLSRLLANEVDLGFTGTRLRSEKCHFEAIRPDRLVIIAPVREPFCSLNANDFPAELLSSTPFILRAPGSATQKEAEAFLINMGVAPQSLQTACVMDSIAAIKQSVKCGIGIAILSEAAVRDMEERGDVLVFRNENLFMHRQLYCVCRKDMPLSPAADLFLRFLKSRQETA